MFAVTFKNLNSTSMLKKQLFSITLGLMLSVASFAQTAKVQVIHNCADTAAAMVDVYINGTLQLNDFGV
jgi:hypothetical protein